jgi:hypothetical protein
MTALARHLVQTMPWATLTSGCAVGVALLALLAFGPGAAHQALGEDAVRVTFLPVIAALAFVPRDPFRPVAQAAPRPAWLTSAGQILLAVPVLAVTCWAQLSIMDDTIDRSPSGPALASVVVRFPAVYPLLAQLTGWCAVTVAAAACCDRSRYADLGGAVAAPVSFAVIAIGWYAPGLAAHLVTPPASPAADAIAWYAIAAAALALSAAALRDRWRRYTRPRRSRSPARA